MITTVSPNRAVIFAVGGFILYWVLAIFVPAEVLRDVFNAFSFGTAMVITITWFPSMFQAIKREAGSGEWLLIMAIWGLWFVALVQRMYVILFNYAGRPDAWAMSAISGFWPYSYMIAGLLFLAAPGVKTDGFRIRAVWSLVTAVAIGSLLAGILIGASISTI